MEPDDIYKIDTFHSEGNEVTATVIFNEKHSIFNGHFPGNPIVPGVVQVQIIKELMEKKTGKSLLLIQGKNIKFLNIISPVKYPSIDASIRIENGENNSIHIKAVLQSSEISFMKFAGIFGVFGQ